MIDDSLLPFSLPSVDRKKITASFDGGRISSDGGAMLLGLAERRLGIADRLAAEITDRRDPTRVVHALSDNRRGPAADRAAPAPRRCCAGRHGCAPGRIWPLMPRQCWRGSGGSIGAGVGPRGQSGSPTSALASFAAIPAV